MRHGSCDLHLHVMEDYEGWEGFPLFFSILLCVYKTTAPLPHPGLCWWQVLRSAGSTAWTRPPHFMCSLVMICIGYSVLNGLRSYSAALFSAAYKLSPRCRDPARAATADPAWVTLQLRALPVKMILMSGAWPQPQVISCSVMYFRLM